MADATTHDTHRIQRPSNISDEIDADAKISCFRDLASYNWLDRPEPSILVPGIPPIWTPPPSPPHLKPDTGPRFVDQNADRYPWSPLEPLVRAVLEMHPDFRFGETDIITDRSPLHNLLAFVSCEADDFQFGVQVVGKTALFVRMEKQTRDEIPRGTFQGYRQAFEDEYTSVASAAEGSTSHHRIVEYNFGGLRLLVRSAADAYLQDQVLEDSSRAVGQQRDEDEVEILANTIRATALNTAAPSVLETPEAPGLTIVPGARSIPHAAVAELTTRFKYGKRPFVLSQKMPDLWIAQTPNFIKAMYQNVGTAWSRARASQARMAEFADVDVVSTKEGMAQWTAENMETISRFSGVLREVVDAARRMGGASVVGYRTGEEALLVRKATDEGKPILAENLRRKWAGVGRCGA